MRQDQFEKIQALNEKLADVFINEANPDNWPGANTPIDMQDKTIRGDRYWMKKNAVATIALIQRITYYVGTIQRNSIPIDPEASDVPDTTGEVSIDNEIDKYEKSAKDLINKLNNQTGKKEYDKHVHGKTT